MTGVRRVPAAVIDEFGFEYDDVEVRCAGCGSPEVVTGPGELPLCADEYDDAYAEALLWCRGCDGQASPARFWPSKRGRTELCENCWIESLRYGTQASQELDLVGAALDYHRDRLNEAKEAVAYLRANPERSTEENLAAADRTVAYCRSCIARTKAHVRILGGYLNGDVSDAEWDIAEALHKDWAGDPGDLLAACRMLAAA